MLNLKDIYIIISIYLHVMIQQLATLAFLDLNHHLLCFKYKNNLIT